VRYLSTRRRGGPLARARGARRERLARARRRVRPQRLGRRSVARERRRPASGARRSTRRSPHGLARARQAMPSGHWVDIPHPRLGPVAAEAPPSSSRAPRQARARGRLRLRQPPCARRAARLRAGGDRRARVCGSADLVRGRREHLDLHARPRLRRRPRSSRATRTAWSRGTRPDRGHALPGAEGPEDRPQPRAPWSMWAPRPTRWRTSTWSARPRRRGRPALAPDRGRGGAPRPRPTWARASAL